jgi:hypothetical protein
VHGLEHNVEADDYVRHDPARPAADYLSVPGQGAPGSEMAAIIDCHPCVERPGVVVATP